MPDDVVLATRIPQTGEEHTVFPVLLFIFDFFAYKRAFHDISAAACPAGSFLACLKPHSG